MDRFEQPYDIFHTLFEAENSEAFVDDFLEIPMRADHVIWNGSANATAGLLDSLVDRMLILRHSGSCVSPPQGRNEPA